MTTDRPLVVQCDTCGTDVEVKPSGNIPKYCPDHRGVMARKAYYAALDSSADKADGGGEPPERDPDGATAVRVCRAEACHIPLHDTWLNEWCPNHWKLISTQTKGDLLGTVGTDAYDKAVLHAIREIRAAEGRAAFLAHTYDEG